MAVVGSNRVRQRLIAAGASPARATQFIQQLAGRVTAEGADLEDVFDAELATLSQQLYPGKFVPPTPDDPEFDDYLEFVKGPDARARISNAVQKATPEILGIYQSMLAKGYLENDRATVKADKLDLLSLPEYLVKRLYLDKDITPLQLKNEIKLGTNVPAQAEAEYITAYPEAEDFNGLFDVIQGEVESADMAAKAARETFFNADKAWNTGIPDKRLQFGSTTNLKQGIVSYRKIPGVEKYFEEANKVARERFPGSSAAAGIAVPPIEQKVLGSKLTPFSLEVKTRQSLKNKRLK